MLIKLSFDTCYYPIFLLDDVYSGCVNGKVEIPVTIPNTEVKHLRDDGTAALAVGE